MQTAVRLTETLAAMPETAFSTPQMPQVGLSAELPAGPLSIADMADLFGVTHRTLHFYEEKGLISARRTGTMRVYDDGQIMRMAVVSACREAGMQIAAIQDMLTAMENAVSQDESDAVFRQALVACKRELTAGISTLRRQMQQVETLLARVVPDYRAEATSAPALTTLERRCLAMMAEGLDGERIATALDMTPLEASALERQVILLFGTTNRPQTVARALLTGMISE